MKMKFGHHGANHPVQDLETGRVFITSQNHGFAVDESDLPVDAQGPRIARCSTVRCRVSRASTSRPFSFQGHPEASPGPQEMGGMFDRFIHLMLRRLQQKLRARSSGKQPPPDKAA
jgi:carbamoyl-phosphate synthase small subunit